jgi:hypothetical protein
VHEVALYRNVVISNCHDGVLILRDLVSSCIDTVADQVQRAVCMRHRFIVFVQLRQDGTNVQVCACNSDVISLQGHLDFQSLLEVLKGSMKFTHLLIVAAKVVACDRHEVGGLILALFLDKDLLCVLQLLERLFVQTIAQVAHSILVACQDQLLEVLLVGDSIRLPIER